MPFSAINTFGKPSENHKNTPIITFLPGGPGLSSYTIGPLSGLLSGFHVIGIDPPGTGNAGVPPQYDYASVLEDMENALAELGRPLLLVGHSFGGIQAVDLVLRERLDVRGVMCLASPILKSTFEARLTLFEKNCTPGMLAAKLRFSEMPNQENFETYLAELAPLYFAPEHVEEGRDWLKKDKTSVALFMGSFEEGERGEMLLNGLREANVPRVFLAGEHDTLYPPSSLKREVEAGGFDFHLVQHAGHFLTYEAPAECAYRIRAMLT